MKKFLMVAALSLSAVAIQAKDIVDTAVAAGNFKTLATALTAAGLIDTLKGKGPFTVFAPTDEAFAKVPKADLDALLADKAKLTAVLTYHVVPGTVTAADLKKLIRAGHGTASIKTVQGGTLKAMIVGGNIVLKDEKGGTAKVTIANVMQKNGVIHVIDAVVQPN